MKKILLMGVLLLSFLIRADALQTGLSVENIVNKSNVYFSSLNSEVEFELDATNHKINLTDGTTTYVSFDYTDDYILLDRQSVTVTRELFEEDMAVYLAAGVLNSAVFNEAGYSGYQLKDSYAYDNFDTYGLVMTGEFFEFPPEGNSQGVSGDFIRLFKISLNTEKIDKLIQDYGTYLSMSVSVFQDATVDVTIEEATADYITINMKAKNYDENTTETPVCYLYRSTSPDGPFVTLDSNGGDLARLNSSPNTFGLTPLLEEVVAYNCSGDISVIDQNVEPNTTYYYKARVALNDNYSTSKLAKTAPLSGTPTDDPIAPTTRPTTKPTTKPTTDPQPSSSPAEKSDNPDTGVEDYLIPIGCVTIALVATYLGVRKKNYLKQI